MSRICIIPAKGASTRLAKKNLLKLGEHSLLAYSIRKAINAKLFEKICVSTEDEKIAGIAKKYGADVPFTRPAELSRDPATIIDVAKHALDYYLNREFNFTTATILLPTSPFVSVNHILEAQHLFDENNSGALLSVTPCEFPPFNSWVISGEKNNKFLEPCFPDSAYKFTQSTSCPITYRSNGAILIINIKNLRNSGHYHGSGIVPYVMEPECSIDIDTEFEYNFAKYIYSVSPELIGVTFN